MKAHKRFDTALRAADIPATLADAATSLGTVGGMFRSIDQTLTLATARALIDATQPDADLDAVFGTIGCALDESGLASGPARVADKMLAQAARFAAKHDGPIKPGAALRLRFSGCWTASSHPPMRSRRYATHSVTSRPRQVHSGSHDPPGRGPQGPCTYHFFTPITARLVKGCVAACNGLHVKDLTGHPLVAPLIA